MNHQTIKLHQLQRTEDKFQFFPHDIYHLWSFGQPPPNQKSHPGPWNPGPIACAAGDDDSKGCRVGPPRSSASASEEWEEVGASVAKPKKFPGDSYEKRQRMLPAKKLEKNAVFFMNGFTSISTLFFWVGLWELVDKKVLWLAASSKQLQSLLTKNSYKSKQKSDDDDDDVFPVGMPGWVQTKFGENYPSESSPRHDPRWHLTSITALWRRFPARKSTKKLHQQTAPKMPSNNMKKDYQKQHIRSHLKHSKAQSQVEAKVLPLPWKTMIYSWLLHMI